jgi:hypothetical protein
MLFTLITTTAIALLGAPAQTQVVPTPVSATVPKWSTYDISLTATDRYDSPYVSVDLLGVFSGPRGQTVIVNGFWDGGSTFRIRFTPTVEGTWTFTTVSDDVGLDAHMGVITCVKAKDGAHGFVRKSDDKSGWSYDDGASVGEATTVKVRARAGRCGGDGDPCAEPVGPGRDHVNVAKLQAADARVAEAAAAGRIAEINLFDPGDAGTMNGTRVFRYLSYMTARYGAYPNVVWCLHPTARVDDSLTFWRMARNLIATLDPYFGEEDDRPARVVLDECAPAASARGTVASIRVPFDGAVAIAQ